MATCRFDQHPSFVWELRNFSRLLSVDTPDFFIDNALYRIRLGFGHTPCDGKCLQVRLERMSGDLKKCLVYLDLARENLKKAYKPFRSFTRLFDKGVACVFLVPLSEWAKPDDELIKDGCVRIVCSIEGMDVTPQDPDKRKKWYGTDISRELFRRDLRSLLSTGRAADLLIKCGSRYMHGHSLVLFSRSRVFENMLLDCQEEGLLELNPKDEPIFMPLLSYIYSGEIGDPSHVCLSGLCQAAARYGLEDLKTKCFLAMRARLGKDNIYDYLFVADTLSNFEFKTAAVAYLVETDELLDTDEWRDFFGKNSKLGNEVLRAVLEKKTRRVSILRKVSSPFLQQNQIPPASLTLGTTPE